MDGGEPVCPLPPCRINFKVGWRQPDIQGGKTLEQAEKHKTQNIRIASFLSTISFSQKQIKESVALLL